MTTSNLPEQMTATLTREETIAALRLMVRKLTRALTHNEWNAEALRILDLAEQISDWRDRRPRRWVLPAEPDCPVSDAEGWVWERTADPDAPWQSGRICTTWPMVLTRGPLTEVTS